ncbi:formyltransferase family protein [Oceanobacter antarcticus]|uniref:phosphoribosylglycinamide formyltransferase 1 n=1 Tax=Oceanobacter antarcticus TaxID=3133425 RepID=A0ABW8NN95_9GAMM
MKNKNLVYIWSLRNAAADRAGQHIDYRGERRYMMSPLEYLVGQLNDTALGEQYSLKAIIHDDDELSATDCKKLEGYGFSPDERTQWVFPQDLSVWGEKLCDKLCSIPSAYRRYPVGAPERIAGKRIFEKNLQDKLVELEADVVVLDGLLVILDELVRPGGLYRGKIVNIHPGITAPDSLYQRRGAYATLDALYGARGEKVVNWETMEKISVPPLLKTGASFHYVDNGIDSGKVIMDMLNTTISPKDTIFELRWNNFHNSLFPALSRGLEIMAQVGGA